MTWCCCGSLALFFCLEWGIGGWTGRGWVRWGAGGGGRAGGTQSKEQGRPTAAAYSCLPPQIYGFLAQCKDYQRELYGRALALRRFIDLQRSPRHRMCTALANKCILGLRVPSMERQESVLRASWAQKWKRNPVLGPHSQTVHKKNKCLETNWLKVQSITLKGL